MRTFGLLLAATLLAIAATNAGAFETVSCRLIKTADLCTKAGRYCAWCDGPGGCYNTKTETCCPSKDAVCKTESETCCGASNQWAEGRTTCCAKNTTSCCPSAVNPQCCSGTAKCCPLGGVAGNMMCCNGDCVMGMCCEKAVQCGSQKCCPGACNNGQCMMPPMVKPNSP